MMMLLHSFLGLLLLQVLGLASGRGSGSSSQHSKKNASAADYLVKGLEQVEPAFGLFEGDMYAGRIPTQFPGEVNAEGTTEGNIMFWLFDPDHSTYDDTLVIWLNGGPGCSSMGGCLFENCPVTIGLYAAGVFGIKTDDPLRANNYGWTNATAIMYVEQPHGTGFSDGPFPKNETDVSRDFYFFLQNFYNAFGQEMRDKKLFFFGESYAGMYAPSIAHYIHERNKEGKYEHINLAGVALGNGWTDTIIQTPAVIDYASWHGMIDSATAKALHQEFENCKDGSKGQPKPFHTLNAPDECGIMGATLAAAGAGVVPWGAPNTYDVTTWDRYPMLDDPKGAIAMFYNNPVVQDALHVHPHKTWMACMPGAGRRRLATRRLEDESDEGKLPGQILLAHDSPLSVVPYLVDLLDDAGIQILIYNGDRDLSTNMHGSEEVLDKMDWSGKEGWANITEFERGLWLVGPTELGGYVKKYKNLQFVVVLNSGHLFPFNRPQAALDLVTRFLGGVSYSDKDLPKFIVKPKATEATASTTFAEILAPVEKNGNTYIWTGIYLALFTIAGFVVGFMVAKRFAPSKRDGYQPVSSNGYH